MFSVIVKIEPDPGPGPSKKKKPNDRKFPLAWKLRYGSWLRYDGGLNLMFCTICEKHDKAKGPWVNSTNNFRLKSLHVHLKSAEHKEAVELLDPNQKSLLPRLLHHRKKETGPSLAHCKQYIG